MRSVRFGQFLIVRKAGPAPGPDYGRVILRLKPARIVYGPIRAVPQALPEHKKGHSSEVMLMEQAFRAEAIGLVSQPGEIVG